MADTTHAHDLTPVVDLTQHHGAGPFRTRLPEYVSLLPPCNHACPAGENIQAWLALAQAGKYRQAWETLMADNPLPAVHGRVCYHPCETRAIAPSWMRAVSIHAVERFLGDMATAQGWTVPTAPPSGKRVLVVGAGPSGLSAAYHLTRLGHAGGDPRGRAGARRHDAFRHPRLSPAARRSDGGDRAHRAHGREDRAGPQGDRRAGGARSWPVRRGVRRHRRACRQARRNPRPRRRARARRGRPAARERHRRGAAARPARGRLRRRQHRHGRRAQPRGASAPTRR